MFRHLCRQAGRSAPRLLSALATLLAFGLTEARAQPLFNFNFTGTSGNEASDSAAFVASGLMPVSISRVGPNMFAAPQNDSFNGRNWPTSPFVVSNQDYFTFTATPTAGNGINLGGGGMALNLNQNFNGPETVTVRSSLDNFATDIAAPFSLQGITAQQYAFSFSPYLSSIGVTTPVTSPIEFRMYAYNAATADKQLWLQSSLSTPNAVVVTGSIVPVPEPALVLSAAAAAAGLAGLYRRVRAGRRSGAV